MDKLFQTFQSTLASEIKALETTKVYIRKANVELAVKYLCTISKLGLNIITTGVGKCSYIAEKTAATMTSYGFKSFFLNPSYALHGDLGKISKADIFIIFSKSGRTQELLNLFKILPDSIIRILISCNDSSPLVSAPELLLQILVEDEGDGNNIAPMASTTAMLAVADGLCAAMVEVEGRTKEDFAQNHPGGSLGKQLLCTVEELMETDPEYLPTIEIGNKENLEFKDLLMAFSVSRYGAVFILENEKLWGIFTDGDLRRELKKDLGFSLIDRKKLTHPARTIPKKALAIDALKLMEKESRVTVLPVIDTENYLIGAIHVHDLIKAGIT